MAKVQTVFQLDCQIIKLPSNFPNYHPMIQLLRVFMQLSALQEPDLESHDKD